MGKLPNPDATVVSILFTIKPTGKRGYAATCTIQNSDDTTTTLEKNFPGRNLGAVKTEIAKMKADYVRKGIPRDKIDIVVVS